MSKQKSSVEFKRVNVNLPTELVERVVAYAEKIGINTTSAYIVLLDRALEYKQLLEGSKKND